MAESDSPELQKDDCSFQWDENSQLYFHASSGFYHDPNAGWYYSSRDGLYYKFENGNYVLLETESNKADELEVFQCGGTASDNQDELSMHVDSHGHKSDSLLQGDGPEANGCVGTILDEPELGQAEGTSDHAPGIPPPTSEWLEDTLIDLYLSGYSNLASNAGVDVKMPLETDDGENVKFSVDGVDHTSELEEGEWIPEDDSGVTVSGASWDEEQWQAQFGQVIPSEKTPMANFPVVDLWNWAVVTGCRKDGKAPVNRLVGRLVRGSAKLHPSMPTGGGLLKTAPICEAHLDLVRVTTGQVYKLQSPSARYIASLSTYDSSNPTKDWGFPGLSVDEQFPSLSKSNGICKSKAAHEVLIRKAILPDQLSASEKHKSPAYRDRAAERRTLHGGFGVGPGQKSSVRSDVGSPSSDVASTNEAAAEALNMSFGVGSYARKILENMGWTEGEALGSSTKGLVEPIQAVGNIGNAGLGWSQGRRKHR